MVDEDDGSITFKGGKLKEKLIVQRMNDVRKKHPDYQGTDEELRNEVLMDMNKSYNKVKYQQTGDVKEPYTNEGKQTRQKIQTMAKLKKVHGKNIVRKVLQTKLEGIRAVKASSSSKPIEEISKPVEPVISEAVESSTSKELSDSGKSDITEIPETQKMNDYKKLVVSQFGIKQEDIDKVSFSGAATKYEILNMIAKEMYQKGEQDKYIEEVTVKGEIDGKIRFKKAPELNQIYQKLVPDPEAR